MLLFEEVSEGKEKKQGNDVTINREDEFADSHVKSSSRDHMESSVTELQREHRYVKLKLLRNSPYRSPVGVISHWNWPLNQTTMEKEWVCLIEGKEWGCGDINIGR